VHVRVCVYVCMYVCVYVCSSAGTHPAGTHVLAVGTEEGDVTLFEASGADVSSWEQRVAVSGPCAHSSTVMRLRW